MTPTPEKTTWQSRKEKKKKSLIGRRAQLHHFRQSDLAKDTIKRIVLHTKLARRRHSGWLRVGAWGETKTQSTTAGRRRRLAHKWRRRYKKAFLAVIIELLKARQEVSRGTYAQKSACFHRIERDRREKKVIAFKLQSSAMKTLETNSKQRGAISTSSESPTGVRVLQTARSVSHLQPTMEPTAHSNDGLQNRSHQGVSDVRIGPISDHATASSSQARQEPSTLPSGPSAFVIPIESLPAWAHWFEPPLSAAQVGHVRERMKTPEEYLSMDPSQRDKVMGDHLSAALRSMCQTFNQSVKFLGTNAGELKDEFLRRRGEAVDRKKNALGPMEDRTIDTVSLKENEPLTRIESEDAAGINVERQATVSMTHSPLRADRTYSDYSIVSKRKSYHLDYSHKRRKAIRHISRQVQPGHLGDVARDSEAVAHTLWRDNPERLQKDLSGRPHSSTARTAGTAKPAPTDRSKTAILPSLRPKAHNHAEKAVEKEKLGVKIPAETDMATNLRAYSQWPGQLFDLVGLEDSI